MEMYDTKKKSTDGTITLDELETLVLIIKNSFEESGDVVCERLLDKIQEIRVDRYGDDFTVKVSDIFCPHCKKKVSVWKWHSDARFTPIYKCRSCFKEFNGTDSKKAIEKIVEAIRELENKIL